MPWEDFIEARIMAPLGMDDCRALPSRVTDSDNRATPHMEVDGELQTTFFSGGGPTAAADASRTSSSSTSEFHSPQPSQRPAHLADSHPQAVQR